MYVCMLQSYTIAVERVQLANTPLEYLYPAASTIGLIYISLMTDQGNTAKMKKYLIKDTTSQY